MLTRRMPADAGSSPWGAADVEAPLKWARRFGLCTRFAPPGCGAGRAHAVRVFLDQKLSSPSGKTHAVDADCLGGSSQVRMRVRVWVRARVLAHVRGACVCVCAVACACLCAGVRGRARVRACACVCVCVGAGRRDDPLRRALLWQAGVLYMFMVGLGLGRQRI